MESYCGEEERGGSIYSGCERKIKMEIKVGHFLLCFAR